MMDESVVTAALALYRALLSAGGDSDPLRLQLDSGLTPAETSQAAGFLRRLGLMVDAVDGELGPVAMPPRAALRSLLDAEVSDLAATMQRLAFTRVAIRMIAGDFQAVHHERQSAAEFEVIRGREALSAALERASRTAERSVAAFHPGPQPTHSDLEHGLLRNRAVLERGVQLRTIHLHGVARLPHVTKYLEGLSEAGAEVRLARTLPVRLIIVDSALALLPASSGTEDPAALMVRSGPLVEFIEQIFEHSWSVATRFGLEPCVASDDSGYPVGQQAEVLGMLASGMRDEGMARRLGVSVRTVRRLVAELMEQLGAESRFEAGVAAAKSGWLD